MAIVYLALGSNVGNSQTYITTAITLLKQRGLFRLVEAPRYKTKPAGYTNQPDFLNTVVKAETKLTPLQLLDTTQSVEKEVGRIYRFHWGPREIDVDIIFYDDQIVHHPRLVIPHLLFAERDFVLRPLCDLTPQLVDPHSKRTIEALLQELPPSQRFITD